MEGVFSLLLMCGIGVEGSVCCDPADGHAVLWIENSYCRLGFDSRDASLRHIVNVRTGEEYLKKPDPGGMPFRIYADLTKEFEIGINEIFQLTFDEPAAIAREVITPGACRVTAEQNERTALFRYDGCGLGAELRVVMEADAGTSVWSLRITNIGDSPRQILVSFPYIEGVRLGPDPANNLATAMDMAGLVVPAWERPGGVLGESNQFSMQWHAVWDPVTNSGLGMIFRDADVKPKRIILQEQNASIELNYFPPVALEPGDSVDMPSMQLLVYQGDWRPAARAYRAWYDHAYPRVEPPAWFRQSDGQIGAHFKKGNPALSSGYSGQHVIESFRELPALHLRRPIDCWEYAFYCRGSMTANDSGYAPHTDGENIIREDLGGAEALRDGIEGVHKLGLHAALYVEGYLMHEDCDLARAGLGERWAVMHKDGSITGPYSEQGFYHMCPGCEEWQDHLAGMVARLLRETGADGVRLDSLGFYYLPCYNPAHGHAAPFGYNEWLKQLLAKVRAAAVAVKPDVLLLTEGPADWIGQWFHGALTARCPRDLPLMRLAVGPFRTYVYATGALWGAVAGYPGGGCGSPDIHHVDWNWLCARSTAHEALVWGDVADEDPIASDPEIVVRRFEGDGYWAVVAARPACQEPIWPRGTGISDKHGTYVLTLSGLAGDVEDAVLCDVETLEWAPIEIERCGADVRLQLDTNWALVILRRLCGPVVVGFDALPVLQPGESTVVRPEVLSPGPHRGIQVRLNAPGLRVTPSGETNLGESTISVPPDALPGHYKVEIAGKNVMGTKRFLTVEDTRRADGLYRQGPVVKARVHGELHDSADS